MILCLQILENSMVVNDQRNTTLIEVGVYNTDKDLASIAEARSLARAARQAQPLLAELTQEQIDRIVTAMANAVTPHAEALAALAVLRSCGSSLALPSPRFVVQERFIER